MIVIDLPDLVLVKIAEYIAEESPFRDKVDIILDAINLQRTCKKFKELSPVIIKHVDPFSQDDKLSPIVLKNIKFKFKRYISLNTITNTWGLTSEDISNLRRKTVILSPSKIDYLYRLQDIKKLSIMKFNNRIEHLHEFTELNQQERFNALQQEMLKQNISMRPDSKMCESYIRSGKGNLIEIVQILKELDFYHTFTDYCVYYAACAANYYCEYGYYDNSFISSNAKKRALQDFNTNYPDKKNLIPRSLQNMI
jgi:hypothetical protein